MKHRTHFTSQGRIVYDRPHHGFSTRDRMRILRGIGPPQNFQEFAEQVGTILALLRNITLAALQRFSRDDLRDLLFKTFYELIGWAWDVILQLFSSEENKPQPPI